MKPSLMTRASAPLAALLLLAMGARPVSADTPDLTESLSGSVGSTRCAGTASSSIGIFADVDGNAVNDTLVVFTSLQGQAHAEGPSASWGYGNYLFFFTGDRTGCGGTTGGVGRVGIRFVDMLAPGFNPANPATWVYRSVPGVQLVTFSDSCNETGVPNPYRQVNAYTQTNAGGTLVGSYTATGPIPPQQVCEFNSAAGIKEIQVRSDFCENSITHFVIRSTASGSGADAGLRAYDGSATIRIACEFPIGTNRLSSPVQFAKNGTNYGVILTDTNSANASRIRIQTSSGTKAWAKLP